MTECLECGDDFRLEDGCEDDGMCHECAHAIAEGQISAQVSARDLTIRGLREELAAERVRAQKAEKERDGARLVLRVIREAIGAGPHDDIVEAVSRLVPKPVVRP